MQSNTKYSIIAEKLRFFLRNISWKKSLTFLFFLILAIIFWWMRVYSQKIDIKLTIPVKYTNFADDIRFEHQLPDIIHVTVRDYGSSVIRYASRQKDTLEIDLGEIIVSSPGKNSLYGHDYEQLIKGNLLPNSEIISIFPTQILYTHNQVSVIKLPVIFDGHMSLSPGYQLDDDISIYPDTVIAYGSKASLDTLRFAYTTKDTLKNITESQKVNIKLKKVQGVDFKPESVKLNILVDKFIEKKVQVPIECLNMPDDLAIMFFPSEVTIPFFVGLKRYNLIESSDFKIQVDYKDIKDLHSTSIPIRIIEAPDFVRTRLPEPCEVEYILERK